RSPTWLFRGQTKHYVDANGNPSIPTSFQRLGCIPPLMFAWSHYAKSLLRAFTGGRYHDFSIGTSQAILQHYGWRSFYVDLTRSPAVACWFAAHRYADKVTIEMCENFEEDPVWLISRIAQYDEV